jgi:hypothetical protein
MLLKRKNLPIAMGLVAVALLLAFAVRSLSAPKAFKQRLITLESEVNQIESLLEPSIDNKNSLLKYTVHMGKLAKSCEDINSQVDRQESKTSRHKSAIAKSGKLCQDLLDVVNYSRALYESSREYILLDRSFLQSTGAANFTEDLRAAIEVLEQTKQTIKKIDYPQVNDPAQSELVSLVDRDLLMAKQLAVLGDAEERTQLAAELLNRLNQDQANILNARIYYWNNTIGVNSLQKAIAQLISEFK